MDSKLEKYAMEWVTMLPAHLRPTQLVKAYPRIVNAIALRWSDTRACEAYMAKLIYDPARPKRDGFPIAIADELLALYQFRFGNARQA